MPRHVILCVCVTCVCIQFTGAVHTRSCQFSYYYVHATTEVTKIPGDDGMTIYVGSPLPINQLAKKIIEKNSRMKPIIGFKWQGEKL